MSNQSVVTLRNVNVYFPRVHQPHAKDITSKPRYSAALAVVKGSLFAKEIDAAINAVAQAFFKADAERELKTLQKKNAIAKKDGDDSPEYPFFSGCWIINSAAATSQPPALVGRDGKLLPPDSRLRIIHGTFVNARIEFWAQDNNFGKRINAKLLGLQYVSESIVGANAFSPVQDDQEKVGASEQFDAESDDIPF